jgi:WD40 repeat protein
VCCIHCNDIRSLCELQRFETGNLDWDIGSPRALFCRAGSQVVCNGRYNDDGGSVDVLADTEATTNEVVAFFDVSTGTRCGVLDENMLVTDCIAISPNENTLAGVCTVDGHLRVWDLETNQIRLNVTNEVSAYLVSCDGSGSKLVTAGHLINVWELALGVATLTIPYEDSKAVISVSLNAEGTRLIVGQAVFPRVKVYDTSSGEVIACLAEADGFNVCFSPASTILL